MNHTRSFASHTAAALLESGIIALIILVLLVAPALAARGGKVSSASVAVPDTAFGETTTATVTGAENLYVRVECWQGASSVYLAVERTDSLGSASFRMGPTPSWGSGAAECSAQAGHFDRRGRWLVDASTDFHVSA